MRNTKNILSPSTNLNSDYFFQSYKKLTTKHKVNIAYKNYLSDIEKLLVRVTDLVSPKREEEFVLGCLMLGAR
ncbi:MAG: hypothetical protein KBC84_06855 [Proteobacteria bacterium]|nr:hypothetical protein [Pseudomonadota bacterium]